MSGNKTGVIIGIAGGVLVLLLVAAVMFGTTEAGAEYGDPVIEGTSLPGFPSSTNFDESATGLTYPTVLGADFSGQTVEMRNDDGKAKAIVFLAHWCPHCQNEVPSVQGWLDSGGGVEGVDIYSVATAMNSGRDNFPASDWLEREGWTSPVIVDDQQNSVLAAYGAGPFPYWVFTNSDGTVALRTAGSLPIEQLEQIMRSLN